MLLYDEMVDTPLHRLSQIGKADLRQQPGGIQAHRRGNRARLKRRTKCWRSWGGPSRAGPTVAKFSRHVRGLDRSSSSKSRSSTIPSTVRPSSKRRRPLCARTTIASMDTPGPIRESGQRGLFQRDPAGPARYSAGSRRAHGRVQPGTIISTAIHEAYPGHYIQFLWVPQAPTQSPQACWGPTTDIEGWAHYCEQMMLDEGYGQPGTGATDARDAKLIRLGQLQDALLRDARFVVGIQMHSGEDDVRSGGKILCRRKAIRRKRGASSRPSAEPPMQPISITPWVNCRF